MKFEVTQVTREQWEAFAAATDGLSALNDDALEQVLDYMEHLVAANRKMNLTAVRDPLAMMQQHVADSLRLLACKANWAPGTSVVDIGTGAGFPLIPLAAALPLCQFIGVESTGKKARFVSDSAAECGLKNVRVEPRRAEELGRDSSHRAQHDIVTARAVGPVISLAEVGLPLLRTGGQLLLMKTESALPELSDAEPILFELGATLAAEPYRYRLPEDRQDRLVIAITKVRPTPDAYPRSNGAPFHKPLANASARG